MTNKTNKEIVIEEVDKLMHIENLCEHGHIGHEKYHKARKAFATNLLSKLNKLDRNNVNSILVRLVNGWKNISDSSDESTRKRYAKKKKAIDQILSLIPEQGEVIFKGMVNLIDLDDLFLAVFKEKVEKYQGKEIQIIIREVK